MTALDALGYDVDIRESGSRLGMAAVGERVAARRYGADDDRRRPLHVTTVTADPERRAALVAKAQAWLARHDAKHSVATPTPTCAPHEVFNVEYAGQGHVLNEASFAAVPRGTPITRRPARARVVSRLAHR